MKKFLLVMFWVFNTSLTFSQSFPDPNKDLVIRGTFFSTTKTINGLEFKQNWNSDSTNIMEKNIENLYSFQMFLPASQDGGITPFTYYYTAVFKKENTNGPRLIGNRKFTLTQDRIVNFYAKAWYNTVASSYQTQFLCDAQKVSYTFFGPTGFTSFTKELPLPTNGKSIGFVTLPLINSKIEYNVVSESALNYPYAWTDLNNTTNAKQVFITTYKAGKYKISVDYPTLTTSIDKVLDSIESPKIQITGGNLVNALNFNARNLGLYNDRNQLNIGASLVACSKYQGLSALNVNARLCYQISNSLYNSGTKEIELATTDTQINFGSTYSNSSLINVSAGLPDGNYTIKVWYETECLGDTLLNDNKGAKYTAYFTINQSGSGFTINLPTDTIPISSARFGVNLACGEFGATPGVYNTDYTYPRVAELDYYKSKGLTLIRMPFKWERIQHDVAGSLDTDLDLMKIKEFVQAAQDRGISVILDMHNYARRKVYDKSFVIGQTDTLTIEHFVDVWVKLANEFKGYSNIYGYDIMNEPHDLGNVSWLKVSQAVINGIRSVDNDTPIIVEGNAWASSGSWPTSSDSLKYLTDPANNIVYQAHCYFDSNASGVYTSSYGNEVVSDMIYYIRLKQFVEWLKVNNKRGMIGEFGVPGNDTRWLTMLDRALTYMKDNNISATFWAGGPWWGTTYKLSIEPSGTFGSYVDKPQMTILTKYGTYETNATAIQTTYSNSSIEIIPNPVKDYMYIASDSQIQKITIYNLLGVMIFEKMNNEISMDNSINLSHIQPGNYLVKVVLKNNDIITNKFIKY